MTQQKIPLFDGLIQDCHDGLLAEAATTIFSPPDKTLAPGTQAFYALHLWLKPAVDAAVAPPESFELRISRGSAPGDERSIWLSDNNTLNQVTGLAAGLTQVSASAGVPVKILDGYVVRGDVTLKLFTSNAAADHFGTANGTRVWGYFQRIGAVDEAWRFIGEPPVGPLFDTGLPIKIPASTTVKIHDFEPDRIDELYLAISGGTDGAGTLTIILADADDNPLSQLSITELVTILGAPNGIRDPASMYDFYGVFGNNEDLASILIQNNSAVQTVQVHGRFTRH